MKAIIEALEQQLQSAETPDSRIELLQELAWYAAIEERPHDLTRLLQESQVLLDHHALETHHIAIQDILTGFEKFFTTSLIDALKHTIDLEVIHQNMIFGAWQWRVAFLLAWVHSRMGNPAEAMAEYRRTYEIATDQRDPIGEHMGLNGISIIFMTIRNFKQALKYMQKALDLAESLGTNRLLALSNTNLSYLYYQINEIDKAETHAKETLRVARLSGTVNDEAYAAARMSMIYNARQAYSASETILQEMLGKLPKGSEFTQSRHILMRNLGQTYIAQERFAFAIRHFKTIIAGGEKTRNHLIMMEAYQHIVTAYEGMGQYKEALECHKKYTGLYKHVNDERSLWQLQSLEIIHQTRETELQLKQQKHMTQQAIAQAEQTQKYFEELNQMKSDFIDSATHDLKNPLTGIRLNTQLLRYKISPAYFRHLERIEDDADRMNRLITDMLDVAKLETGAALTVSRHSMNRLIEGVAASQTILARNKSIDVSVNLPSEDVQFYFDHHYIERCLSNIISNAIKYSPQDSVINITLSTSGDTVKIRVEDQGIGIPEKDLPHIFNRFYRVEHESTAEISGTGLGLSIVQTIVQQHEGDIYVESTLGKGSTFVIALPYVRDYAQVSSSN